MLGRDKLPLVEVGDEVRYIGTPKHLKNLIGEVTRISDVNPENITVFFPLIDKLHQTDVFNVVVNVEEEEEVEDDC
jgi:hypothetical protein